MNRRLTLIVASCVALAATVAIAQQSKDATRPASPPATKPAVKAAPPAAAPEMQLPPGMTAEDMQAMTAAATPGPMHKHLTESVGAWKGKTTSWMAPGAPPMQSECVATISPMMDGRFTKCEWSGDMPGMGMFNGFGLYGFDNVAQKFQSTWIDNAGTGMMVGTGELSSDGKTMTWNFTYNCPITKQPTPMREVDRQTGKDSRTMEMFTVDPKSGKEFKMMEIAMTRTPGATAVSTGH